MQTRLIFVGGFLGAGKTTLLATAAQALGEYGKRVGLITNDQAPELVDTALLRHVSQPVAEVSGSCLDAVGKLLIEAGGTYIVGNLTGGADAFSVRGSTVEAAEAKLTINARVEMTPVGVDTTVRSVIESLTSELGLSTEEVAWRCLSPGRPTPTYRYDRLISLV